MCLFRRKKDNCSLMDIGLTADVHSHILPGVDDGSPDTAESTAILEEMHRLGIRKVIFTPHVSRAMFPTRPRTCRRDSMLSSPPCRNPSGRT